MTTMTSKDNYGCGSASGSGFGNFNGNGSGDYEQGGGSRYFSGHGCGCEYDNGTGNTIFTSKADGWARGGGNEIMDGFGDLMG